MALAVVLVIALAQALTLVALDGPGCSGSHSSDPSLDTSSPRALALPLTLVALDGPGCSASHSPGPSLDTSSPRWPWL